jgi:tetratricopeptide (TPR) repeat protein
VRTAGGAVRNPLCAGLVCAAALTLAITTAPARATGGPLTQVNAALQAGEADHAIALLQSLPTQLAGQAEARNLECRVQLSLGNLDAAVRQCELAVQLDAQNSNYHLWLGRTLGQKASRASFLSAFSLAKRVHAEFELAVRLDPNNINALYDLGQYDVDAPGIVGGGLDKAAANAARLDRLDSTRAHVLRGHIAEKRGDFTSAEREFRQAIAVSPHPGSQWIVLAIFFRNRQRWTEMEAAIRSCAAAAEHDQHSGAALYDGASILMETNRDPVTAVSMMKAYLANPVKTEEAPAFAAWLRLARLESRLGHTDDAVRDLSAALALAHDYRPAQEFHP